MTVMGVRERQHGRKERGGTYEGEMEREEGIVGGEAGGRREFI